MNVSLITPAAKRSLSGNRATAVRWAGLLRELGHRVVVAQSWPGDAAQPAWTRAPDLMIAIHAYRSAASISAYRARYPTGALVVLLAGTDIYRFQHSDRSITEAALSAADRIVGLHDRVALDIAPRFASRLQIIHQSATPLSRDRAPSRRHFDACVIGHLREEKDPMRTAYASRLVPPSSRLRVLHLGRARNAQWAEQARAEMAANARYHWRGEVPRYRVRQLMHRAHLMVISSMMEGGANVVSEAVAAGLPVIASDISGNIGLLGPDHPGYYPVSDTEALASLLARAEGEPGFLSAIEESGRARAHLFERDREREGWARLLAQFKG